MKEETIKKHYCCRCNKCLTDKSGFTLHGLSISVKAEDDKTKFYKKQLGKYKLNKSYYLCLECLFKSFGIIERG